MTPTLIQGPLSLPMDYHSGGDPHRASPRFRSSYHFLLCAPGSFEDVHRVRTKIGLFSVQKLVIAN